MGNERMEAESFVVHGWFEASFQAWITNRYTCGKCLGF